MELSCPNRQRYHSNNFKKQSQTQEILSARGYVILKFVGTSCGLGLLCLAWDWKARKMLIFRAIKGQGVKITRLISIFTSKRVWKFLEKIQLTKSDLTKTCPVPCLTGLNRDSFLDGSFLNRDSSVLDETYKGQEFKS